MSRLKTHMTMGDLAGLLRLPLWRVRRAVDRLARQGKSVSRLGQYRVLPIELLGDLVAELEERGIVLQPAS